MLKRVLWILALTFLGFNIYAQDRENIALLISKNKEIKSLLAPQLTFYAAYADSSKDSKLVFIEDILDKMNPITRLIKKRSKLIKSYSKKKKGNCHNLFQEYYLNGDYEAIERHYMEALEQIEYCNYDEFEACKKYSESNLIRTMGDIDQENSILTYSLQQMLNK